MKTNLSTSLFTVVLGLAVLFATGCAEKAKVAGPAQPPAKQVATATPAFVGPVPAAPEVSASWADIKDLTFDMHAQFLTGLKRLEARVDRQIAELDAKRATMTGTAATDEWDFVMKEMASARSYLRSMGEEMNKATRETWDQQKDKVGVAWVRTQDTYAKVKSSTTT